MEKKYFKAVITGGKEQYGVWIEELPGVYGAGDTLEEAKDNLKEGLKLYMENNAIEEETYEVKFTFDTSGYLKYISNYISFAGLHKITGINQKQLWSYAHGYREPSRKTSDKIRHTLHRFGENLTRAELEI